MYTEHAHSTQICIHWHTLMNIDTCPQHTHKCTGLCSDRAPSLAHRTVTTAPFPQHATSVLDTLASTLTPTPIGSHSQSPGAGAHRHICTPHPSRTDPGTLACSTQAHTHTPRFPHSSSHSGAHSHPCSAEHQLLAREGVGGGVKPTTQRGRGARGCAGGRGDDSPRSPSSPGS